MNSLDNMLLSPDDVPQNPVVKALEARKLLGDQIRISLQKNSSPFGSAVSGFTVLSTEKDKEHPPEVYDWDDDLNTSIIDLGIKAVDLGQEGERFARVLRAALRKVERRFGDGYMNAVLVELIDQSDLGKNGEIGKVRRLIQSNPPDRSGRSYNDCRDTIAAEIGGRAKELRDKLGYDSQEIKTVMDKALAQYLDERFSITSLRNFGWIDDKGRTTRSM